MTIRKLLLCAAALVAMATPVLADDVGFSKTQTLDGAASDRKAIAELYALVGLSLDCDKSTDVNAPSFGGPTATIVLTEQIQPLLTKEEYLAGREAVIKAQPDCLSYAVQMRLATEVVLHLAQERGLGPKK
jgi:hypothetical protein